MNYYDNEYDYSIEQPDLGYGDNGFAAENADEMDADEYRDAKYSEPVDNSDDEDVNKYAKPDYERNPHKEFFPDDNY